MAKRAIIRGKILPWALGGQPPNGSARTLCLDLREHRLGDAEAGLLKLSDGVIEVDEPSLFGFIENRKRSRNPQAAANCFLTPSLLIHEHYICMYLRRERDRLTLAWIELPKKRGCTWDSGLLPMAAL